MTTEAMLALAIAVIILGLSPGLAVFATVSLCLKLNITRVYYFMVGIVIGDLVLALLAMAGLAALAATYTSIFVALKLIGGGYLIYLGVKGWLEANKMEESGLKKHQPWQLFSGGFMLTCGNPKDLLFFVVLLPAFIDLKTANFVDMAIAGVIIAVSFLATLSVYALATVHLRKFLLNDKSLDILRRAASVMLISVGAMILWQSVL